MQVASVATIIHCADHSEQLIPKADGEYKQILFLSTDGLRTQPRVTSVILTLVLSGCWSHRSVFNQTPL